MHSQYLVVIVDRLENVGVPGAAKRAESWNALELVRYVIPVKSSNDLKYVFTPPGGGGSGGGGVFSLSGVSSRFASSGQAHGTRIS